MITMMVVFITLTCVLTVISFNLFLDNSSKKHRIYRLKIKIQSIEERNEDLNESYDRLYAAYVKLAAGTTSQGTSNKTKKTRQKTHWEILKIKPTDDRDEIMKAFWEMAKKHHPDRGGKPENFRKVVEAKDKCFEEMGI